MTGRAALALLAAAAVGLSGCGRKEPVDPESLRPVVDSLPPVEEEVTEPAGLALPPGTRIRFSCDNGETLTIAWFLADDHVLLERGRDTLRLDRQPAEEGVRFAAGVLQVSGTPDALTLADGRAEARCTALEGEADMAEGPAGAGGAAPPPLGPAAGETRAAMPGAVQPEAPPAPATAPAPAPAPAAPTAGR